MCKRFTFFLLAAFMVVALTPQQSWAAPKPGHDVRGGSSSQVIPWPTNTPIVADDTEYGNVGTSSSLDHTFEVGNDGGATLTLTDVTLNNTTDFTVISFPPTVAVGAWEPLVIRFHPQSASLRQATVTFDDNVSGQALSFNIQGTGQAAAAPEMDMTGGATDVPISDGDSVLSNWASGKGTLFADTVTGADTFHDFTILNSGSADLDLTGGTRVQIAGANPGDFTVTAVPSTPVTGSGQTTFTIRFTPLALGQRDATVSIANNDSDENPYNFVIRGTGVSPPAPEMDMTGGATDVAISDGDSVLSDWGSGKGTLFADTDVGQNVSHVFTILNSGNANLNLTGGPLVQIAGANPGDFTVTAAPSTPVAGAGQTTFTIRFAPTAAGQRNATVSIDNNDANENPYNFVIRGTGRVPEMDLTGGLTDVSISDGDSTLSDWTSGKGTLFADADVGTDVFHVFTILNSGTGSLTLSGGPLVQIAGANPGDFTVTAVPSTPVAGLGQTTFTIRFTPTAAGQRNATVSIDNNDANENPYNFVIRGTGLAVVAPEMDMTGGNTDVSISDGDTVLSDWATGKGTLFADTNIGADTFHDFTILNSGTASLDLSGGPLVQIAGANPGDFSVTVVPSTPVASSGQTTFTIRFTPTAAGQRNATVSIANNDANENPYNFIIRGTGVGIPEMDMTGGNTDVAISDGDSVLSDWATGKGTLFADTNIGADTFHDFTILNSGTGSLDLSGGPLVQIAGANSGDFTVTVDPSTPVASSGQTTFTIRFTPLAAGERNATVTIANSDANENPYNFVIRGIGLAAAPVVAIGANKATVVQSTTATLWGDITSTGGEDANERGVYWSATPGFTPPGQGTKVPSSPGPFGTGPYSVNATVLTAGALLYFESFATNSQDSGYSGAEQAFQMEPDVQHTGINFSGITEDAITIGWTRQGSPSLYDSIVVMCQGVSACAGAPTDFNVYSASLSFLAGDNLGGSTYVMYKGSGNSITVDSLDPSTDYWVSIYTYAGSGASDPDGINYREETPLGATSQTIADPGVPPTLGDPAIVGFATANTAQIGSVVTNDGGTSIVDHGVVWDVSPLTAESKANTVSCGGAIGVGVDYDCAVGALPDGKQVYFNGFAENSGGSFGYSAEGYFYTEPSGPVTLSPGSPGATDIPLSWTPDDDPAPRDVYDGYVILAVAGAGPITDHPQDGVAYSAAAFGYGDVTAAGVFVVYRGTANSASVLGFSGETQYTVAVYDYSGVGTEINYHQVPDSYTFTTVPATNHREAYEVDCGTCHAHNGASGFGTFVPRGADAETTCKQCHSEFSGVPGEAKFDVINHDSGEVVDCGQCHEVHKADSQASPLGILWTLSPTTGKTEMNQNWVRGNVEKYFTGLKKTQVAAATPVAWHDVSDEADPTEADAQQFAAWDGWPASLGNPTIESQVNASGKLTRLCQACHTNGLAPGNETKYHTNDPVDDGGDPDDDGTQPVDANAYTHSTEGQRCFDCHAHNNGFSPAGGTGPLDCPACHNSNQGGAPPAGRRQVTGAGGDFDDANNVSHHVNNGDGSAVPTMWDCNICHAEADPITGLSDQHYDDTINMRNADGPTSWTDEFGVYPEWGDLDPRARDEFCLSCHDSDGASRLAYGTPGDNTTSPRYLAGITDADAINATDLNPFNDGLTNSHEPDGFDGSSGPYIRYRPENQYGGAVYPALAAGIVDVKSQFNQYNPSYHGVDVDDDGCGAYTNGGCPAPSVDISGWDAPILGAITGGYTWTTLMHCEDCHYGDPNADKGQGVQLNGHGTKNSRYFLMDSSGNDAQGNSTDETTVCWGCHSPKAGPTNFGDHSKGTTHYGDDLTIHDNGCMNCHGGGYNRVMVDGKGGTHNLIDNLQWGGIHGIPYLENDSNPNTVDWVAGQMDFTSRGFALTPPDVFIYGSGIGGVSNWNPDGNPSCGDFGEASQMNNCVHHMGKDGPGGNYDRPAANTRSYRGIQSRP